MKELICVTCGNNMDRDLDSLLYDTVDGANIEWCSKCGTVCEYYVFVPTVKTKWFVPSQVGQTFTTTADGMSFSDGSSFPVVLNVPTPKNGTIKEKI